MKKILTIAIMLYTVASSAQLIPKDKQLHFIAGAVASAPFQDEKKALIAGITAATVKELYDQADYGGFDGKDLAVTVLGTIVEIKTRKFRKKLVKKVFKKRKKNKNSIRFND